MDDFDWDGVQVIKDPDAKQVEISFIKDDEGGTVGSELPCVRILAPTEYFPYKDNSGHFYIAYLYDPAPVEITGTVTHTTGGTCEPNSIIVPTEMDATSTFTIPKGATEVRVDLNLNEVLVDVSQTPDYKAAYTATITSVTNGAACGEPQCIKFWAGTSVIPDPEDPGPEPDPETEIPPDDDQLPECQPHDCDAYTNHLEFGTLFGTAGEIDAIYNNTTPKDFAGIRHITKQSANNIPTNTSLSGEFLNWPGTASVGSTPCNPASFYFGGPANISNLRMTPMPENYPDYYMETSGSSYEDRGLWEPLGINIDIDILVLLPTDTGSFGLLTYQMLAVNNQNNAGGPYTTLEFYWDKNAGATGEMYVYFKNNKIYTQAINPADNDVIRFRYAVNVQQYAIGYMQDSPGGPVPSLALTQDIKISLGNDLGFSLDFKDGLYNTNLYSTAPFKKPDSGQGVFPVCLGSAPLLAMFEAGNPATEAANRQKVADIRRSFQEYTPPDYCLRIP